jgi:hypothetical protein
MGESQDHKDQTSGPIADHQQPTPVEPVGLLGQLLAWAKPWDGQQCGSEANHLVALCALKHQQR